MITNADQLRQWQKWVEEDPEEALRAMEAKIDGLGSAGPELVQMAREQYAEGSSDNIEIDDDAGFSATDNGTWVQAWVWLDGVKCDRPC